MVAGKKTDTLIMNTGGPMLPNLVSCMAYARNLQKNQLGGVIFGCTNTTMSECLSKQLFGLPAQHYTYVKNIDPGLPLFLFNYSDKKLHGIFEAASSGQMNIDPYGWTIDGSQRSQYPAQVQIRVRQQCHPLPEERFKSIIIDNYYNHKHFWFELDHAQTSKVMTLMQSLAVAPSMSVSDNAVTWRTIYQPLPLPGRRDEGYKTLASEIENNSSCKLDLANSASCLDGKNRQMENLLEMDIVEQDENNLLNKQVQTLDLHHSSADFSAKEYVEDSAVISDVCLEGKGSVEEQIGLGKNDDTPCTSSHCQFIIGQLVQGMEELKAITTEQALKMSYLEQKLAQAEEHIHQLKDCCMMSGSVSNLPSAPFRDTICDSFDDLDLDPTKSIYLVGGYDGESWLSALDLYFPLHDASKSLRPMSTVRSYASIAQLKDEFYVLGGGNGYSWYDTVESYKPATDQWNLCPSLIGKKGSLGGATLNEKIFAIGGGNGMECFADVEMLDLDIGQWIPTRSMLQKRFALAAAELNGALYATGGFDGRDYLKSAERFDPREYSWTRIASMNTKRGCHSLVVYNEKLYALGGFDGNTMVPSTEIYDPRLDQWVTGEPMNNSRGYTAAAVVDGSIFVIGGVKSGEDIVDTVEHFKEGGGWKENTTRAIGKRCFLSAFVF